MDGDDLSSLTALQRLVALNLHGTRFHDCTSADVALLVAALPLRILNMPHGLLVGGALLNMLVPGSVGAVRTKWISERRHSAALDSCVSWHSMGSMSSNKVSSVQCRAWSVQHTPEAEATGECCINRIWGS